MRNFDGNMVADEAVEPDGNAAETAKFLGHRTTTTAAEFYERQPLRPLSQQVGTRLRDTRKAAKLTLAEVAQRCGTTPQTIQRLETANMTLSVDWVERLCGVLGMHPMELFADADVPAFQLERRVQDICLEAGVLTMRSQDFAAKLQQFVDDVRGSDA